MFNGKISLLHKNVDFSKNAVRNFNFILGYTILRSFRLSINILKRNLDFDYFKNSFRVNKFRPTISNKEMFHKRFFFGRSFRSMQPFTLFISPLPRLLYCYLIIKTQKLLYILTSALIIIW